MQQLAIHIMKNNVTRVRGGIGGFTLIEMMVAVSIFSIVMLVSTGAIFSMVEANKKARAVQSVMTNLNFALESMSRDIRVGSGYSCESAAGSRVDCLGGGDYFSFYANRDVNGNGIINAFDTVTYRKVGSRIEKEILTNEGAGGLSVSSPITASEIQVTNMQFYVTGTGIGEGQPKVTVVIQGYSGTSTTRSDFNIQTTVSQRTSDI
jgi:prepilin-type N-terminal cleavage/methylation domain-containing protein